MSSKLQSQKGGTSSSGGKTRSNEEIVGGFHALRAEQRNLVNKLSELEMDLNEHKIVIETLKLVNEDRKCFRMIGGVLCERTVKDVMPVLITNRDQLTKVLATLTEQLTKKGQEINEYKEQYNIKIRGQEEMSQQEHKEETLPSKGNVLVSNN